jgi:thioredoxin reductase
MTLSLLLAMVLVLAFAGAVVWHRHAELHAMQRAVGEQQAMARRPDEPAPLQVPVVDLTKCLGCGTCVRECPETGVLGLVHGQAAVLNPAACVGHARCVSECPAGAITLSRGDVSQRRDLPVLDETLQAVDVPGLYLIGEITGRSLIRTATSHGAAVAARLQGPLGPAHAASDAPPLHDVVIVGAGPGGFACALGCAARGLDHVLLDRQAQLGGAVAQYPRRKLVLTDAVTLPLHGELPQREYGKEELMALWQQLAARHRLGFRGGVTFDRVEPLPAGGGFLVHTDGGVLRARQVVLAIGRRGRPKRLQVPGEDLPHVTHGLLDAAAFAGRSCVVVGGGDSAVEAALALAEQPGATVALVHRQEVFHRLRGKNRERLEQALAAGRLEAVLGAEVAAIASDHVEVAQRHGGGRVALQLPAQHVFVLIGGEPPFAQLERSGVSFDPTRRPAAPSAIVAAPAPFVAPGDAGWRLAVSLAVALALATLGFVLHHADYYLAATAVRAGEPVHALLRPDRRLGLGFGFAALAAVVLNLAYLARRQQWWGLRFGSLAAWMSVHVVTGVLAVLAAMLHAAMAPRPTAGGYAFAALCVLLLTGAIGRWFYAWLPRSTNGRELELAAVRHELGAATRRVGSAGFAAEAWQAMQQLLQRRQWGGTFAGRCLALVGWQWDLWRARRQLQRSAQAAGIAPGEVAPLLALLQQAHRAAIAVAHLEDLRALLGSWRWLHRQVALLMVLLLVVHIVVAIAHGVFVGGGE